MIHQRRHHVVVIQEVSIDHNNQEGMKESIHQIGNLLVTIRRKFPIEMTTMKVTKSRKDVKLVTLL